MPDHWKEKFIMNIYWMLNPMPGTINHTASGHCLVYCLTAYFPKIIKEQISCDFTTWQDHSITIKYIVTILSNHYLLNNFN